MNIDRMVFRFDKERSCELPRLAALAAPLHQDHRDVSQALLQATARKTRIAHRLTHDVHSKAKHSAN